jgi:polyribonucleotide nucleotidyltransferase
LSKPLILGRLSISWGQKTGWFIFLNCKMVVPKKPPISVKMVTQVKVKVIGFDDRGKVKLSMKRVDQETGADLEAAAETAE